MIKKLIKYRVIVIQVVFLTLKYRFTVWYLSNQKLIQLISKQNNYIKHRGNLIRSMQPKQHLIRLAEKIIDRFLVNSTCLVRSLVKRDLLRLYGFNETITLGVSKKQELLQAHAWICESDNKKFVKVF